MRDARLWRALEALALDDPAASFSFIARLARENGWSRAFAAGAVREYKRFLYLLAVAPWPVTPSDVVDQVWHLHLVFTRSYWDEVCGGIIGWPLHHGPTKGGAAEDTKFHDWYARTLALYAEEFGAPPPRAFWPPADARFAGTRHRRWIDRREVWVVSRASLRRLGVVAMLVGAALILAGLVAAFAASPAGIG